MLSGVISAFNSGVTAGRIRKLVSPRHAISLTRADLSSPSAITVMIIGAIALIVGMTLWLGADARPYD